MADETTPSAETTPPAPSPQATPSKPPAEEVPERIYLISYPKVVFLYPTFLAALVAGVVMSFAGPEAARTGEIVGLGFLILFGLNLVVLSFDFPRTTSLTLFFFGVAVFLGLFMLFRFIKPDLLPVVTAFLQSLRPVANNQFYFLFAGILGVIYVLVAIAVQFDYWEVRPNELLHHHGILSDLERFSAPNLRIDKEINDVFEYFLLRSGRLILHPSNERKAITLENVFFISDKEKRITRMLGALQVQVRGEAPT